MEAQLDESFEQQDYSISGKSSFKPHAKFTPEDDELLRSLVGKSKNIDWGEIAHMMPGRNQRQCRERWTNYLCPTINNSEWKPEEDALLKEKVELLGKKWVKISKFFDHRTDQMCKNRFNILERKKLNAKRGRKPSNMKKSPTNKVTPTCIFTEQEALLLTPVQVKEVIDQPDYFYTFAPNDFEFQTLESISEPDDAYLFFGYP